MTRDTQHGPPADVPQPRWAEVLTLGVLVTGLLGPLSPGVAVAMMEAGTYVPADFASPQPYAGTPSPGEPAVVWSHEIRAPGATYIAVHFVDFSLSDGDTLIVSDPDGIQSYTMTGAGKMNAGTFWARHIKGEALLMQLVATSASGGEGFRIDKYAVGHLDLSAPLETTTTETFDTTDAFSAMSPMDTKGSMGPAMIESICSTSDLENAICYDGSHPVEYDMGRAVARLLIDGKGYCTGWLASPYNHMLTNEHCITNATEALNTDFDFMAEAAYCSTTNCQGCFENVVISGAVFVQDSYNYDYCLLEFPTDNLVATYGYLPIDDRAVTVGEQIFVPQHPGGRAKEFAIFSTEPSDTGGVCRINNKGTIPCQGAGYSELGYYADTESGSSGSPVIAVADYKVIALHHCGGCPNGGVPMSLIYPEIEAFVRPGRPGVVSFDQAVYDCSQPVTITLDDDDLWSQVNQAVTITTSHGDEENLVLDETPIGSGHFEGTIGFSQGTPTHQDGLLQIAADSDLTVTYNDADVGYGVPGIADDTATTDCAPAGDFDDDGDVDLDDFGHFQTCMTGTAVPQNEPDCLDARLDGDLDVDDDDLALLRGCFSGADIPADITCLGS